MIRAAALPEIDYWISGSRGPEAMTTLLRDVEYGPRHVEALELLP